MRRLGRGIPPAIPEKRPNPNPPRREASRGGLAYSAVAGGSRRRPPDQNPRFEGRGSSGGRSRGEGIERTHRAPPAPPAAAPRRRRRREISWPSAGAGAGAAVRGANLLGLPSFLLLLPLRGGGGGEGEGEARRLETRGFSLLRPSLALSLSLSRAASLLAGVPLASLWDFVRARAAGPGCKRPGCRAAAPVTGRWGRSCRGAPEQGRRRGGRDRAGLGTGVAHRGRWVFGTDGDGGGCVSARLRCGA